MKTHPDIVRGSRIRHAAEPLIVNVVVGAFLAIAFLTNFFDIVWLLLGGRP
jgi:hypothetical protein